MMRCLMISGGPLDFDFARAFLTKERLASYDRVIAVDMGAQACKELSLHPDFLVGDFDTLGHGALTEYETDSTVQLQIHRPEKDETDTELAFRTAMEAGCTSIDLLGATGGRIDHEISNIHLLYSARKRGLKIYIYDAGNKIYLLDAALEPRTDFFRDQTYGSYVSFLPLTEEVKGITLTGFRYPLHQKDISILNNPSLCVSNEIVSERAVISFSAGVLICVESKD